MSTYVWSMGILVNTMASLFFLFQLVNGRKNNVRSGLTGLLVIAALIGLLLMSLGTVCLYLQQASLMSDLTRADTIFPVMMFLGYYSATLSFFALTLRTATRAWVVPVVGLGLVLVLSGLGMLDFMSYWNEGSILVVYTDTLSERIGILASLAAAAVTLYVTVVRRLEFVSSQGLISESSTDRLTRSLFLASSCFFLQFLVPRAEEGSVTNPLSVKVIGLLILLVFVMYLSRYSQNAADPDIVVRSSRQEAGFRREHVLILVLSAGIVGTYAALMNAGIPVLSVSEKLELGIPILFLGDFWGDLWFADYVGCILPLACTVLLCGLLYLRRNHMQSLRGRIRVFLLSCFLIGYLLSLSDKLGSHLLNIYSETVSVLPFLVGPVLAWILVSTYLSGDLDSRERLILSPSLVLLLSTAVFVTSYCAALFLDITTPWSPYGIIHLGGAAVVDGLLWAPILSASIFAGFLVLTSVLRLWDWPLDDGHFK